MRPLRLCLIVLALAVSGCSIMPTWLGGDDTPKKSERLPGKRLDALPGSLTLTPDAELAKTPMNVPAPVANAQWTQHGGNAVALLENPALPAAFANQQKASVGKGEAFDYKMVLPPVVGGGMAFAMDALGHISAHDAKNINDVKWASPGVVGADEEAILGGGLAFDKGRLYATSGRGLVAAFDAATGREIWRMMLDIPIRSAPRVEGGHVYVVTVDSQCFALDAASGKILWTNRGINEGKGFLIEATPAATPDWVAAPYASGEIHVLHADDGTEGWFDAVMGAQHDAAISAFTGIGGDPVIDDGMLYVAGSADMFAAFQLDTGQRVWDQPVASVATPWVAGDYVFVLTTGSAVIALDRTDGRIRWMRQLPQWADETEKKDRLIWNGPVLAGGRILVVGAHGQMAEIKPQDGSVIAMTEIPEGIYTPPVVAGGRLYLVGDDATLVALY